MSEPSVRYRNWEYGGDLADLPHRLARLSRGVVGSPEGLFWRSRERRFLGVGRSLPVLHASPECRNAGGEPVVLEVVTALHEHDLCPLCGGASFTFWAHRLVVVFDVNERLVSLVELLSAPLPALHFRGRVWRALERLEAALEWFTLPEDSLTALSVEAAPYLDAARALLAEPPVLSPEDLRQFLVEVNKGNSPEWTTEQMGAECYLWVDLRAGLSTFTSHLSEWVADSILGLAAGRVPLGQYRVLTVPLVVAWAAVRAALQNVRTVDDVSAEDTPEMLEVLATLLLDVDVVSTHAALDAARELTRLDRSRVL